MYVGNTKQIELDQTNKKLWNFEKGTMYLNCLKMILRVLKDELVVLLKVWTNIQETYQLVNVRTSKY